MEPWCDSDEEVFWGPVTAYEIESLWRHRKGKKNTEKVEILNGNSTEEHIEASSSSPAHTRNLNGNSILNKSALKEENQLLLYSNTSIHDGRVFESAVEHAVEKLEEISLIHNTVNLPTRTPNKNDSFHSNCNEKSVCKYSLTPSHDGAKILEKDTTVISNSFAEKCESVTIDDIDMVECPSSGESSVVAPQPTANGDKNASYNYLPLADEPDNAVPSEKITPNNNFPCESLAKEELFNLSHETIAKEEHSYLPNNSMAKEELPHESMSNEELPHESMVKEEHLDLPHESLAKEELPYESIAKEKHSDHTQESMTNVEHFGLPNKSMAKDLPRESMSKEEHFNLPRESLTKEELHESMANFELPDKSMAKEEQLHESLANKDHFDLPDKSMAKEELLHESLANKEHFDLPDKSMAKEELSHESVAKEEHFDFSDKTMAKGLPQESMANEKHFDLTDKSMATELPHDSMATEELPPESMATEEYCGIPHESVPKDEPYCTLSHHRSFKMNGDSLLLGSKEDIPFIDESTAFFESSTSNPNPALIDNSCQFEITSNESLADRLDSVKNDTQAIEVTQKNKSYTEDCICEVTSSSMSFDLEHVEGDGGIEKVSQKNIQISTTGNISVVPNYSVLEVTTSGILSNENEKYTIKNTQIDLATENNDINIHCDTVGKISVSKQINLTTDNNDVDDCKSDGNHTDDSANENESTEKSFVSANDEINLSSQLESNSNISKNLSQSVLTEIEEPYRQAVMENIDDENKENIEIVPNDDGKLVSITLDTVLTESVNHLNEESHLLEGKNSSARMDVCEEILDEIKAKIEILDLSNSNTNEVNCTPENSIMKPADPCVEAMDFGNVCDVNSSEKSFVSVSEDDEMINSAKPNDSLCYVPPDKKQCMMQNNEESKELTTEKRSKIPKPGFTRLPVLKPSALKVESIVKDSVWASDFRKKKIPKPKKPDYIVSPGKLDGLLKCPKVPKIKMARPQSADSTILPKTVATPLQLNTRLFNTPNTQPRSHTGTTKVLTPPKSAIPKLSKTIGDTPAALLKTPPKNPKYKDVASPVANYIKSPTTAIIRNVTPKTLIPSCKKTKENENLISNLKKPTLNLPMKFYSSANKVLLQTSPNKTPVLPKMGEKQKAVLLTPKPQILKHLGRVNSDEKKVRDGRLETIPKPARITSLHETSYAHLPLQENADFDMSVLERQ